MKNRKEKKIKNKRAVRFGVLDAVIILMVIIAVVGVYFRYNIIELVTNTKNLEDYTISYSIKNIRYTTPNYINIGDEVYFADDGGHFGTLINASENMGALSITPSSEYFTTSKAEIIEIFYPDSQSRVDATGRLTCRGRYSDDGGFLVNGSAYVAAGQKVNIKTENVTVTITINGITKTEAE